MNDSYSAILKRFGQAVRVRRVSLKLSQEALAEKADLHRTYIADIERGTRNVSLLNLLKLAKSLDCPVSELLAEIDKGLE